MREFGNEAGEISYLLVDGIGDLTKAQDPSRGMRGKEETRGKEAKNEKKKKRARRNKRVHVKIVSRWASRMYVSMGIKKSF